jgi:hypothetical protein
VLSRAQGWHSAPSTYTNGEFFSANLAPGVYSVMGFVSGDKFFALERGLRENTFTVEAGRVTYAGSYKLGWASMLNARLSE